MSIAEKLTKINNIKEDIKAALEYKGLTVNDLFDTYAELIRTLGALGSESSDPFASIGYNRYELMPWLNNQLAESQKVIDAWDYSTKLVGTNVYFYPVIDTRNVTDMSNAFSGCTNLRSVGLLDTIKVTNMASMFKGCVNLITIPEFATSNVTNMSYMFLNCSLLENIPTIDTSSVTSMACMFDGCISLKSIPLLDTSNVTNMSYMFLNCNSLLYAHINAYNTSNVTNMSHMFYSCLELKQISFAGCDLRKVTNWNDIVSYSNNLEVLDLTNTKISDGFKFSNFKNITFTYEGLDTSYMTKTNYLFTVPNNNNVDISNFNLSNVTDMSYTFSENTSNSIIVGNIDTSKVTNMAYMFLGCSNITNLDLTGLDVSKVTTMNLMFYNCVNLTNLNITGWDTSSLTSMVDMFSYCKKIDTLDLSSIDISKVTNIYRLFQYCTTNSLILDGWNFSNVTSFDTWVSNQSSKNVSLKNVVANGKFLCPLATESIDLTGINTTKCTSFNLNGCKSPTINLSSFNTSNFTSMSSMFSGCSNVTSLDLSNFDYSNVTNMSYMFNGCSKLSGTLTMSGNNKVTNMSYMFLGCSKLTYIDLTHLKLDAVYDMSYMFLNCTSLKELKMGGNPAKLGDSYTTYMFGNIKTKGVFKYNPEYDYKYIIDALPSTWKTEPLINITNCTDLTIEADDVYWGLTYTTIRYTAVVNGTNPVSGATMTGITITGEVKSDEFGQNLTDTDKTITISYTLGGRTASITITLSAYSPWTINLNNQWLLSTDVVNPDPTLYEGVYESFSNIGVNSSSSTCSITISGLETFSIYVRSDGESSYDYVTVYDLDSTSAVKKSFLGLANSGTTINAYTLVTFTNIDPTTIHTITIKYSKDGTLNAGTDKGYILIPKNQ